LDVDLEVNSSVMIGDIGESEIDKHPEDVGIDTA
jgi:hypothetical protein